MQGGDTDTNAAICGAPPDKPGIAVTTPCFGTFPTRIVATSIVRAHGDPTLWVLTPGME